MRVEEIKTGKDLETWGRGVEESIDKIAIMQNTELKEAWKHRAVKADPEFCKEFGNWFIKAYEGKVPAYEEKTVLGTPLRGDAITGSYTVPVAYSQQIFRLVEAASELMPLVNRIPMTTRTLSYAKKLTGASFTYLATETTDVSETNPTWSPGSLVAASYGLYVGLSEQILEDSFANLGQYLADIISEGWLCTFETQLLMGTGAPCTGVMKSGSANILQMAATAFDNVTLSDLQNTIKKLTTKAKRRGARWLLSATVLDIIAGLLDANGVPLLKELSSGSRSILGYPYVLSDYAPGASDSAANTPMLALGNPALLTYGDRVSLEIKFFDQTERAITNTEVFFRGRVRAALECSYPEAFAVLKTATA